MKLRNLLLALALLGMLMLSQNILNSQSSSETDEKTEEQEYKSKIENPNTKEDIAKALSFFDRANRTSDEDAALNDRIEGLTRFQEILSQDTYKDDVIYNKLKKIHQGARVYVKMLIEGMDDKIIDLYKSRYEKVASNIIENAVFNKDTEILKSAIRTYPYTDAAVSGAIQGARILIEQNKLSEAISIVSELIYLKSVKNEDKATLISQLAFCYNRLLWEYELDELLEFTKKNLPNSRINLGGTMHFLPNYVEDMLKNTQQTLNSPAQSELYPKDGGNFSNNKIVQNVVNPENYKWSQALPRTLIGSIHQYYGLNSRDYSNYLKKTFPAVSDTTVYVPQRNNITAYNLYSGDVRWAFSKKQEMSTKWIRNVDSAVIYTVTCDDSNVYAPIETPVPLSLISSTSRIYYGGAAHVTMPKRELMCFNKHDGAIRWRVGAKWDADLPLHEILSYPIAPTVVENVAYVVGCTVTANAHFYLAAFDINGEIQDGTPTGNAKLLWIAKVGTGQQEINMFGNPIREPVPLGLSFGNNKLTVCTNVGILSTFDANTGEKLWAHEYEQIPYLSTKSQIPSYRKLTWFNRPPIVYKNKVLVAPLDANKVFCYDLNTGKLLWNYRYNPYGSYCRYLIGIYDNKLFFGGSQYLFAVDLESGKLKNALDIIEETHTTYVNAAGKPVIMNKYCLIPTNSGVVKIDLKEVKVVQFLKTDSYSASFDDIINMGGNLICAENVLIGVDSGNISVSYDMDKLLDSLLNLEKMYPTDLKIKFRLGVLFLENSKTDEAIAYLKKIIDDDKQYNLGKYKHIVKEASRLLFNINYENAVKLYYNSKYKELDAYVALAKGYAQTKEEFVKILLINVRASIKNRSENVFNQLDELLEKYPEFEYDFPLGEMKTKIFVCLQGALFAQTINKPLKEIDYWQKLILFQPDEKYLGKPISERAVIRINELINENSRKIYDRWDKKAEELFNSGIKNESEESFTTVIDGYPNSLVCERAYCELIMLFIREDKNYDAMITIQEFFGKFAKSNKRAELMLRLYDIYVHIEILYSARDLLLNLGEEFKGQKIEYGSRTIDIDLFVKNELALDKFKNLSIKKVPPTLSALPLEKKFHTSYGARNYPKVVPFEGTVPKEFENQIYAHQSLGLLLCLNAETGKEIWTINVMDSFVKAFYINKTFVIVTQRGIYNLDPKDGNINWKRQFNYVVEKVAIGDGILAIIGGRASGINSNKNYTLSICNIDDGHIISDYQFTEISSISDIDFFDQTLLIYANKVSRSQPVAFIGFDIDHFDTPKYEIIISNHLSHSYSIVTANKHIVVAPRGLNQLRVYNLKTGAIENVKQISNMNWNTQRGNEKIFLTGLTNRDIAGYDPETFEQKWVITLKSSYYLPNIILNNEKVYFFYRTRDRKYIVEEYDILTGKQIWEFEVSKFAYSNIENLDLVITKNYIIAIQVKAQSITNPSNYTRKYGASISIINKKSGKEEQFTNFEPYDSDTRTPDLYVINGYLLMQSYSLACYGSN